MSHQTQRRVTEMRKILYPRKTEDLGDLDAITIIMLCNI